MALINSSRNLAVASGVARHAFSCLSGVSSILSVQFLPCLCSMSPHISAPSFFPSCSRLPPVATCRLPSNSSCLSGTQRLSKAMRPFAHSQLHARCYWRTAMCVRGLRAVTASCPLASAYPIPAEVVADLTFAPSSSMLFARSFRKASFRFGFYAPAWLTASPSPPPPPFFPARHCLPAYPLAPYTAVRRACRSFSARAVMAPETSAKSHPLDDKYTPASTATPAATTAATTSGISPLSAAPTEKEAEDLKRLPEPGGRRASTHNPKLSPVEVREKTSILQLLQNDYEKVVDARRKEQSLRRRLGFVEESKAFREAKFQWPMGGQREEPWKEEAEVLKLLGKGAQEEARVRQQLHPRREGGEEPDGIPSKFRDPQRHEEQAEKRSRMRTPFVTLTKSVRATRRSSAPLSSPPSFDASPSSSDASPSSSSSASPPSISRSDQLNLARFACRPYRDIWDGSSTKGDRTPRRTRRNRG
eukprot:GHVT01079372.1.p1 GENE.GHVT01079372.1~~GHVT01079372.1.p1  ORF type:complete len:475 (-),score=94.06 GHVT01079372.1:706-2130(-)